MTPIEVLDRITAIEVGEWAGTVTIDFHCETDDLSEALFNIIGQALAEGGPGITITTPAGDYRIRNHGPAEKAEEAKDT